MNRIFIASLAETVLPRIAQSDILMFMLLSEHLENNIPLTSKMLEGIASRLGGAEVLSLLLRQSCGNVQSIYNVLAAALLDNPQPVSYGTSQAQIHDELSRRMRYSNFNMVKSLAAALLDSPQPRFSGTSRGQIHEKPSPRILYSDPALVQYFYSGISQEVDAVALLHCPSAPWLHENFLIVKAYVEETDLCGEAQSHSGDYVLAALSEVFSDWQSTEVERPPQRQGILDGMNHFMHEQELIGKQKWQEFTQRQHGTPTDEEIARLAHDPNYQHLPFLTDSDVFLLRDNALANKSRARTIMEASMEWLQRIRWRSRGNDPKWYYHPRANMTNERDLRL
jgi:hypothetical protein